jgi:hypothetical protein
MRSIQPDEGLLRLGIPSRRSRIIRASKQTRRSRWPQSFAKSSYSRRSYRGLIEIKQVPAYRAHISRAAPA